MALEFKLTRPESGGVSSDQSQIYIQDITANYGVGGNPTQAQISVHVVAQMLDSEENIPLTVEPYVPTSFSTININLKDDGILVVYGFAIRNKSTITVTTSMANHVLYDTVNQKLQKVVVTGSTITYEDITVDNLVTDKTLIYVDSDVYHDIIPFYTCATYPELFYKAKVGECKDREQLSKIVREIFSMLWGGAVTNFGQEKYERARDCFRYITTLFEKAKYYY